PLPCFRFLPVVAFSGSLSPPKPSSARLNDKSTSSENRSMTPNTLDNDVPPLKSNPAGGSGKVKSRLSVQQTQKSFSIISAVSPRRRAVAANKSVRSVTGSCATSSMTHQLLVSDL